MRLELGFFFAREEGVAEPSVGEPLELVQGYAGPFLVGEVGTGVPIELEVEIGMPIKAS